MLRVTQADLTAIIEAQAELLAVVVKKLGMAYLLLAMSVASNLLFALAIAL